MILKVNSKKNYVTGIALIFELASQLNGPVELGTVGVGLRYVSRRDEDDLA